MRLFGLLKWACLLAKAINNKFLDQISSCFYLIRVMSKWKPSSETEFIEERRINKVTSSNAMHLLNDLEFLLDIDLKLCQITKQFVSVIYFLIELKAQNACKHKSLKKKRKRFQLFCNFLLLVFFANYVIKSRCFNAFFPFCLSIVIWNEKRVRIKLQI